MQKRVTVIILWVLLLAGIIYAVVTSPFSKTTDTENWTVPTPTADMDADGNDLNDEDIADLWAANALEVDSLQVDVTMTNADGTSQGTMQIITDGEITQMVATSVEGTATIIYTTDASYMQMEGRDDWIKLPSLDQQPIQPITFEANKLAEVRSQNAQVNYLWSESCEVGECDVYEGTDETGTSKVYFNKKDSLLAKVVARQPDGITATMIYTYDVPVNIEVPTNIQEFDIGSFQQGDQQLPTEAQIQAAIEAAQAQQ